MDKDFGSECIRHDIAMQDAFKAAYECFKSESKFVAKSSMIVCGKLTASTQLQ